MLAGSGEKQLDRTSQVQQNSRNSKQHRGEVENKAGNEDNSNSKSQLCHPPNNYGSKTDCGGKLPQSPGLQTLPLTECGAVNTKYKAFDALSFNILIIPVDESGLISYFSAHPTRLNRQTSPIDAMTSTDASGDSTSSSG